MNNFGLKKIVLLIIIIISAVCLCFVFKKIFSKDVDVKQFVNANEETLNEFVEELLREQNESFSVYQKKSDFTEDIDLHILDNLNIDKIAVEKMFGEDARNCVWFYLKDKPSDNNYYNCGFFYSEENVIIDYYGNKQYGDKYEYDGMLTGKKCRYRANKICDNWFYFEEAVWN